jgi:ATP/maltotriose-dependent transcriptional regulator MalT
MDTTLSSEDILELLSDKLSTKEIFVYTLMIAGMSEENIIKNLDISLEEYNAMIEKFNLLSESLDNSL